MNRIFVFIVFSFFLSSCSRASDQEVLEGFNENKEVFEHIVYKLKEHLNIHYVENGKRIELVKNSSYFDSEDKQAYRYVEEKIKSINIDKVEVLRHENDLEAVLFQAPLKAFDWSKMFKVVFVSNGVDVNEFMPSSAQCALIEPSWFFCEYKTN